MVFSYTIEFLKMDNLIDDFLSRIQNDIIAFLF